MKKTKKLPDVPCVVLLTPSTSPWEEIICGPFGLRRSAEEFATALAHGGCVQWRTKVTIKEWNK